ncbi:Rieske 2Fe-2S domain-containing protein [Nocardia flavorosea]|uniref:cholesterol 7-desaturase n=1 Tax=Nocardia flavorosea TaxID=53429 RepID=A0A846YEM6_9NOCA|nr:Rieske 2Fe-2S domain-containing protein [Nocardia flavorosea]NKY57145.1 Rieske (2Fe-2S) protein [Nocardia flavorosea]
MTDIAPASAVRFTGNSTATSAERYAARDLRAGPPPFPHGWFAVAFSDEVRPGTVSTRRFMDREIVVYRTRSGTARAIESYCPHLGAHFGHGGTVAGEEIRCPFHGFRFDTSGRCTSTPYGSPPPAAHLGTLEMREALGVILVWHGAPGIDPWELELPEIDSRWRPMRYDTVALHGHPQEITENGVDSGHLAVLHGFEQVKATAKLTTAGPRLRAGYSFRKPLPLSKGVAAELSIDVQGLGFSVVEVVTSAGWTIRELILPTPAGGREVEVRIATMLRTRSTGRASRFAWTSVEAIVERTSLRSLRSELLRDREIWQHKKYLGRPALAAGDGPIGPYRAWARQFYPDA